ncbi:MAG: hypothetical protein HY899_00910 [Deltaproteobacteria bacterium]|nr:hypothetical protein [Deltaproteobacteria bacterium]
MKDRLLVGVGRHMIPLPRMVWTRLFSANDGKIRAAGGFMSKDHHRVRDFVVTELPRAGVPLAPQQIAEHLGLSAPRVVELLGEMERRLTFLFRNERGEVTWAYPVTVDQTPHHARFSTGEEAYSP